MTNSSLNKHRQAIDAIDAQLLELLNTRATHASEIGAIKLNDGVTNLYDPAREVSLMDKLSAANQGPLKQSHILAIYREIMSSCLDLEQQQTIAFLGPEGTFTHMAALKHFGNAARYIYHTSIPDIFDVLSKGECDYAVVPIENSTEGMVSLTIDMLSSRDLLIIGELEIPIRHCLLGQTGIELLAIKEVHAHQQALSQCQHWLQQNLAHASLHNEPSNGVAVQKALNNPKIAAVGSEVNATLYNLSVLAENVEDVVGNKTRFVVVANSSIKIKPTGKDKTTLFFAVRHKPGALYRVLGCFAKANIDLTRLESRPVKNSTWSYSFFVELRGHISDTKVSEAINLIETECSLVKFLGSYPAIN